MDPSPLDRLSCIMIVTSLTWPRPDHLKLARWGVIWGSSDREEPDSLRVRDWCNGSTVAFQASSRGSSPLSRSMWSPSRYPRRAPCCTAFADLPDWAAQLAQSHEPETCPELQAGRDG